MAGELFHSFKAKMLCKQLSPSPGHACRAAQPVAPKRQLQLSGACAFYALHAVASGVSKSLAFIMCALACVPLQS